MKVAKDTKPHLMFDLVPFCDIDDINTCDSLVEDNCETFDECLPCAQSIESNGGDDYRNLSRQPPCFDSNSSDSRLPNIKFVDI